MGKNLLDPTKGEIKIKRRLLESERLERWRDQLGVAPQATREALSNPAFRETYSKAIEDHFYIRVPLYFEKLEERALGGDLRAIELMLKLFWPPYQRLLYGAEKTTPDTTVGNVLRNILCGTPASVRMRKVREIGEVEVSVGNGAESDRNEVSGSLPQ